MLGVLPTSNFTPPSYSAFRIGYSHISVGKISVDGGFLGYSKVNYFKGKNSITPYIGGHISYGNGVHFIPEVGALLSMEGFLTFNFIPFNTIGASLNRYSVDAKIGLNISDIVDLYFGVGSSFKGELATSFNAIIQIPYNKPKNNVPLQKPFVRLEQKQDNLEGWEFH